ncbi:MAG: hypothetical protein ACI9HK_004107 [Pirellulaceae bacterium]|jgi:hypothetical protein
MVISVYRLLLISADHIFTASFRGSIDAGGDFDGGDFAVVKPNQMALGARVDNDVAGTVVGMDVHAFRADGASDSSLQFFDIERRWCGVDFCRSRSSVSHGVAKVLIAYQYAATRFTKRDRVFVHQTLGKFALANGAVVSNFLANN